jgi:tetratricopeptide (TPR) repeat protein
MMGLAGLACMMAGPAAAAEQTEEQAARQYASCIAQAESDAEAAFDQALAWRDMGGGEAAEHCQAKALFYLEQYGEAGRRFEALAQKVKTGPAFKAELLAQAAQAWMQDGNPQRADDVLTAALQLDLDNPALWVDRGLARVGLGSYGPAAEDFSRALEIDADRVEALTFRAAARRYLENLDGAAADLARALTLDPGDPDALLERGILRRLQGDAAGARADWLRVIEVAPDTAEAATAQDNLQKLELGHGG